MLYMNLGFQWTMPNVAGIGACVSAQGVHYPLVLDRAKENLPASRNRIFDPQMYMRELDFDDNEAIAKRLATYPWINPEVPDYDGSQSVTSWTEEISAEVKESWPPLLPDPTTDFEESRSILNAAMELQMRFGVHALIIPSPLIRSVETDFSLEAAWIDRGLEVLPQQNDRPVFATLAISDICFQDHGHNTLEFLETLTDQISARSQLAGVYIVLEQYVAGPSTYIIDSHVAWSLLNLCHDFSKKANFGVFVNFTDVFGLTCLAAGANAFCSGPTTKGRRLCFADYLQRGGGGALPRFYSHSLIQDLLPERDVENKITEHRLLRLLHDDESGQSEVLFEALRTGQEVKLVGEWQERINNTQSSNAQYMEVVARATSDLLAEEDKITAVLNWLQDAERNSSYLSDRFDTDPLRSDSRHIRAWRSAFERYISDYDLL